MKDLFVSTALQDEARSVIREVQRGMLGRMAYELNNVDYLLWAVSLAGDGDYLEIGVLHGGSLIAAALLKKRLGLRGSCVGIDPLDGYYIGTAYASNTDPVSGVPVSLDTIRENELRFGVSLEIVRAKSDPFPFSGRQFAVTYIDGDHWQGAPLRDWEAVRRCTSRFVVFDNDSETTHPSVHAAVNEAGFTLGWKIVLRQGITCILERQTE